MCFANVLNMSFNPSPRTVKECEEYEKVRLYYTEETKSSSIFDQWCGSPLTFIGLVPNEKVWENEQTA